MVAFCRLLMFDGEYRALCTKALSVFVMLAVAILIAGKRVQAQPVNGIAATFQLANLGSENISGKDICCGDNYDDFWGRPQTRMNTELGRNTYWLKFSPNEPGQILDFGTLVDRLTMTIIDPATGETHSTQHAGDENAATERSFIATHIGFKIPEELTNEIVLVKIEHDNELAIEPRWIEQSLFLTREQDAIFVHALVTGSAGIMLLFNLLLGLLLRKFLFIAYAFFVGSLILSNLVISGMGPAYIWPAWPNFTGVVREIGMVGNLLFFGLMIRAFLEAPDFRGIRNFGILLPAILAIPIGSLWLILPQWQAHFLIGLYMMIATVLLVIVVSYLAYRKVERAKLLLPTLVLVIVPTALSLILPKNSPAVLQIDLLSIDFIVVADHLFELVVFLDSLLFSLLFAYQIRMAEHQSNLANQELASLQGSMSRKIIDAVDVERRRIASDLHDTAGQGMLAVSSRLMQLLRKETFTAKQQREIKRSADYSRGVVGDIRRISHDLHPASIDHLGWHSAIEELFEQLADNTDINCRLKIKVPEETLNEAQRLHLYRISQEIAANMAKHSDATEFTAIYELSGDCLVATFTDNGHFRTEDHQPSGKISLGHLIIGQRIEALNGDWDTKNSGNSTQIMVRFPVQPCRANERSSS